MRNLLVTLLVLLIVGITYAQKIEEGEINGAEFQIFVPEDWNGGLVMYVHGYEETEEFWGDIEEGEEEEEERRMS